MKNRIQSTLAYSSTSGRIGKLLQYGFMDMGTLNHKYYKLAVRADASRLLMLTLKDAKLN